MYIKVFPKMATNSKGICNDTFKHEVVETQLR